MNKSQTKIQDVMTICPHSVGADQQLSKAKEMLHKYGIRHLPVQSAGKLVGVITDRDIQFITSFEGQNVEKWQIKDALTPEPYVVAPDTLLCEVLDRMYADKIGCTLVEANGKVVGIFTTTDACRVLSEVLA